VLLQVDPKSPEPLYQQIMEQIRGAVASGRLVAGQRMPSVRELATQLRINPNTVMAAYRELTREGLLDSRPRSGLFVSEDAEKMRDAYRLSCAKKALGEAISGLDYLGLSAEELKTLLDSLLEGRTSK
jgi:GntR family transcriptional regulator